MSKRGGEPAVCRECAESARLARTRAMSEPNKLAVALAVREAMREHRIAFPSWPRPWTRGRAAGEGDTRP